MCGEQVSPPRFSAELQRGARPSRQISLSGFIRFSEITANPLIGQKANFDDFFGARLINNANSLDFDSAIPRFESWRPSHVNPEKAGTSCIPPRGSLSNLGTICRTDVGTGPRRGPGAFWLRWHVHCYSASRLLPMSSPWSPHEGASTSGSEDRRRSAGLWEISERGPAQKSAQNRPTRTARERDSGDNLKVVGSNPTPATAGMGQGPAGPYLLPLEKRRWHRSSRRN